MFLGGSERDRDSATAYRMSVEVLAMLLAVMIQGQVLSVFNADRKDSCIEKNHELTQTTTTLPITPLHHTREAFLTSALVLGALFFICSMVLFLGVKEQRDYLDRETVQHRSYLKDLKKVVGHVSYQRLVLGFLFSSLAFQMSLGIFGLFCIHVAGLGDHFLYLMLTILLAATVSVPLCQKTLVKLGKKRTLFIGLPLLIPALLVFASVKENVTVYVVMCVLVGISVATMFLLPWSMLPDVVDEFVVQNPCCMDLEPLFFSCSCFCNKLGGGLSAGISTMTLHLTGYRAGVCIASEGVVTALRILMAPVPIILLLLGLAFFYLYPIDETRRQQIQNDLGCTRSRAEMVPTKEKDAGLQHRNQHHRLETRVFLSKTSITSLRTQKFLRNSPSPREHCILFTPPHSHNSTRSDCGLEKRFHKPSSKNNIPVSQRSSQKHPHKYYKTHAKGAKVTWV